MSTPVNVVYVDTQGDDRDPGSPEAPFQTLARALRERTAEIRVGPGSYPMGRLLLTRPIRIVATSTGTTLRGRVSVSGSDIAMRGLTLQGSLEVTHSRDFQLDGVTMLPEQTDDTVAMVRSTGRLEDTVIRCAPQTCMQVRTSTVVIRGLRLEAPTDTRRGLRISRSRVDIENLEARGTRVAHLQAEMRSVVNVSGARLTEARGYAVVAVIDSMVDLANVETASIADGALFAQTATVVATSSRLSASGQHTIHGSGAMIRLIDSRVKSASASAIRAEPFDEWPTELYITNGTIDHRDRSGIHGTSSLVEVRATRFLGRHGGRQGNAIQLEGPQAKAAITDVEIDTPAGVGIDLRQDAVATVTATITAPSLGGIRIDDVLSGPVTILDSRISDCKSGSAVRVLDSANVRIRRSLLTGCPEAGLLAGDRAGVRVTRSAIRANGKYGIAAFGGAQVWVSTSTVGGSPWGIFSACTDKARVVDGGENHITSRRGTCL